jgi:hypothetical protein
MIQEKFILIFIPANSSYNTHRKNIEIFLKACHDKTGNFKMLVEPFCVCVCVHVYIYIYIYIYIYCGY